MKEHWSVSKEKLVNLEEGLTLESEPTGLKVVRERRSTCNVLVQYVKLILYIEFALLIGWACYSLWQTYRIESMEVKVGDLIGKPHREIVIGSQRENDPIKSDETLDLPAASTPMYENILHENDGSLERMIDNLSIEKGKLIIVNDKGEWYVKLGTTARSESKEEFITGHPKSFTEFNSSPVKKASVEDLQPLDWVSESTTDSAPNKKDSVNRHNYLLGRSRETEESSDIDSSVQKSEEIWPGIVSGSYEEKVKDSDEVREGEFHVYSKESESSRESEAESKSNEMTPAKHSHLVIAGEALEPFKWLFQGSGSSEESTSERSDAKIGEEDGSIDKSMSVTDDSFERTETEDSEHNSHYESTESMDDSLDSYEKWFAREDKMWRPKGAPVELWGGFLRDLDKYDDEDGATDRYEYDDTDSTTSKELPYINNMSEDEEFYSEYDSGEVDYLRMLSRWPPIDDNDNGEQSTPLLDPNVEEERNRSMIIRPAHSFSLFFPPQYRDGGEQKYSSEDAALLQLIRQQPEHLTLPSLNSKRNYAEEIFADVADSSDSDKGALPWERFGEGAPISTGYPKGSLWQPLPQTTESNGNTQASNDESINSNYMTLGTTNSEMVSEENDNAPTSEEKRTDKIIVQWPWFDKTEPGDDYHDSNEIEMASADLRALTATVTQNVLGFSADGVDLLECTMNIVEGIISPVVCKPHDSVTAAGDLYEKTSEKEDSLCGSGEYYHFTGICLPYPNRRSEEQGFAESDGSGSESKMIPGHRNVETSGMTINDDGIRIWKGLNVEDSDLNQLDSVLRLMLSETDSDENQSDFKVGIDDDDISPIISEIERVMRLNGASILIRDFENKKAQLYKNQNSMMEHTDDEFELPKMSSADPDTEWEYIEDFYLDDIEDMGGMIRKRRATINVPSNLDESRNNPVMQLVFRNLYDAAAKGMQQDPQEQAMNDVDFQKFANKMEFLAAHIDRLHKRYLHQNELNDDYVSMEFPVEDY